MNNKKRKKYQNFIKLDRYQKQILHFYSKMLRERTEFNRKKWEWKNLPNAGVYRRMTDNADVEARQ